MHTQWLHAWQAANLSLLEYEGPINLKGFNDAHRDANEIYDDDNMVVTETYRPLGCWVFLPFQENINLCSMFILNFSILKCLRLLKFCLKGDKNATISHNHYLPTDCLLQNHGYISG